MKRREPVFSPHFNVAFRFLTLICFYIRADIIVEICSTIADIGTVFICVKAFGAISATICAASLCRETPSARAGFLTSASVEGEL